MTRYEERTPSRRAWLILLAVCAAAWIGLMLTDPGAIVVASILVGMLGGITAITMWSMGRYGNVLLTDSELRVGRDRIPLSEIDPWSVSRPGEHVTGRLAGGAFASTVAASVIGIVRRDGQRLAIESKHPDALRTALEQALDQHRSPAWAEPLGSPRHGAAD